MQGISRFAVLMGLVFSQVSSGKSLGSGKYDSIIDGSLKQNKMKPKRVVENCVDFSGIWSGQCVERANDSRTESSKVTITQSKCKSITKDNIIVNESGFSSIQSAPAEFDMDNLLVTLTTQGAWNDSQTQFTIVDHFSVSPLGLSALSSETLSFDGDQLIVRSGENSLVLDSDGRTSAFRVNAKDCRYSRQQ